METKKIPLGFVNADKPSGLSSSVVVNKIKRLTGLPSGHMGTLDPLASGVLPVGVGNATRLFNYFLEKRKVYESEFTFGVDSDTLDSTGELVFGGSVPTAKEIEGVLSSLTGEVLQIPPKYSAKNVGGRRGYELARAGVEFELPPKKVNVYSIELLGKAQAENVYRFRIECGGGTYIRSIARDMAAALETKAVMSALRRTKSGAFEIENAVPFEHLTAENITDYIVPTEELLPFERLDFATENRIFNGIPARVDRADGEYKAYRDGIFYGIALIKDGRAKIATKLC
ncbi:MAG: tRNA pseudouridine(55) synthase TruB [Clostridia bacterium]|nr:tRNA pseudouridine(55) synthase TruB [Clostridia bacterium]